MTVKIEKSVIEECEVTFPFYAMREGDESSSYVKITEDGFFLLEQEEFGLGWRLHKQKFRGSISLAWWENPCNEEDWLQALERLKEYKLSF